MYFLIAARGIESTAGGLPAGGKVDQPLDVVVTAPEWALTVVGGFMGDAAPVTCPGRVNPVILVSPDKHDPDRGWIGSDRPRVRMDDPDLTVTTVPTLDRGSPKDDPPAPQMYRAERVTATFRGGPD